MADTKYLLQRHQTWYVKVKVPKELQETYRNTHVVKSLKTQSLTTAQHLRHGVVQAIKEEFQVKLGTLIPAPVMEGLKFRQEFLKATHSMKDPEEAETHREEVHSDILDKVLDLERSGRPEEAAIIYRVATTNSPLLTDTLETWLGEAEKNLTKQTAYQYRSDANRFVSWAKGAGGTVIADVTKRFAGRYVSDGFPDQSPKTINRHISSLSMWWRWMEKKGFVEVNPWAGQSLATKRKKGAAQVTRRQYTTEEITKLLMGLEARPLGYLFRLGLFSGARLDELCSLQVSDVVEREDGLWLSIKEGKTENSIRTIPVHSSIKPLVDRLVIEAKATTGNTEGWLFTKLTPGGPDSKRSWNVSKKFTRERRKLEVDDPATVFHSTRKNLIEALEAAEVPLHTAKLLVGHERDDMTYGRYSRGEMVNLRAAIEKVRYPEEVMRVL